MKIVLTGGGTGGHLMPLLSVAEEIKKNNEKAEIIFIGPRSDFNDNLKKSGIRIKEIRAGKIRRYFSWENFLDAFRVLCGIFEACLFLAKEKPDMIFSKGGFASFPTVFAGSIMRIPIFTHESDLVPGLANKIISKLSKKVFVSFKGSSKYFTKEKIIFSGNPVRKSILDGDRKEALKFFGFVDDFPVILIFGGSQGAQFINDIILNNLEKITNDFQIIHICGDNNFIDVEKRFNSMNFENKNRYRAFPFLSDEMGLAYAVCDFVISRAGANSLSEIIALEKPSLIIPLSSAASNHQYFNAKYFFDEGLLIFEEEKNLDDGVFLQRLEQLRKNKKDIIDKLRKYNESLSGKRAEKVIVDEILNLK